MMSEIDLPEIKIVRHRRARRLKLTVSSKGIRLTVPSFASASEIKFFLNQSEGWLRQTWSKQQILQTEQQQTLPNQIQLCYHDQVFDITYQTRVKKLLLEQQQLIVHPDYAGYLLTQFVIQQAKQLLSAQLLQYANRYNLTVAKVRIATPRTRWGSCSADKSVMLHAGLLLMPKIYADYVLLHELAHTQYMHHQASFWHLLEQLFPNAKVIQKQVKQFRLPSWWQPKLS